MVVMLEVHHIAIYDTYMELPKAGTGIDLLGRLSRDDWRQIAAANLCLGGESEAEALGSVEQVMHTDEIEGERARVIGYRQTEDGSYELCTVEGVIDLVSSLENNPEIPAPFATYTKEMAALCVRTVQNDTAMDYYFPLDPQAILSAELFPDDSVLPRHIRKLRHYVDKTQEAVEKDDVRDAASRKYLIDDLNGVLDDISQGTEVRIDCRAYRRRAGGIEYGVDVEARSQVLFGAAPLFVWRDNRPILEVTDLKDNSVVFYIDIKDVVDILPIYESGYNNSNDLFEAVFTEEFQQLAWQLATDLKYTDEPYFSNTVRNHIKTLSKALPDELGFNAIGLSGFVISPSGANNKLQYEFIDSDVAYFNAVKFVRYDGAIYAVLELLLHDDLSGSSRKIYAVPSRDKLLRFESLNSDTEDLELAVDLLHDIARDVSEVFGSEVFYDFSLEDQLEILKQYEDESCCVIRTISEPREFKGECVVMSYRCLPGDLLSTVSWNDAALKEVGVGEETEPFNLRADKVELWNPELEDSSYLTKQISNILDLPLSLGEPMLILENSKDDVLYLVRIRDIVGLSRGNPQDIS